MLCRPSTAACLAALLLAAPAGQAARDPLERIGDELRAGHYERARKAADAIPARSPLAVRAAVLGARAERHLGLLREARGRLEEASVRAPDDLPLRAEEHFLEHVKDIDRSHDHAKGGDRGKPGIIDRKGAERAKQNREFPDETVQSR